MEKCGRMDGPGGVTAGDKTVSIRRRVGIKCILKQTFKRTTAVMLIKARIKESAQEEAFEIPVYLSGWKQDRHVFVIIFTARRGRQSFCTTYFKVSSRYVRSLIIYRMNINEDLTLKFDKTMFFFSKSCVRTLPNKHMENVVETIRKFNISALLVIGGFEVRNYTILFKDLELN